MLGKSFQALIKEATLRSQVQVGLLLRKHPYVTKQVFTSQWLHRQQNARELNCGPLIKITSYLQSLILQIFTQLAKAGKFKLSKVEMAPLLLNKTPT